MAGAMAPPAMEVPFEPAPEQAITGQPGYQPGLSAGFAPASGGTDRRRRDGATRRSAAACRLDRRAPCASRTPATPGIRPAAAPERRATAGDGTAGTARPSRRRWSRSSRSPRRKRAAEPGPNPGAACSASGDRRKTTTRRKARAAIPAAPAHHAGGRPTIPRLTRRVRAPRRTCPMRHPTAPGKRRLTRRSEAVWTRRAFPVQALSAAGRRLTR